MPIVNGISLPHGNMKNCLFSTLFCFILLLNRLTSSYPTHSIRINPPLKANRLHIYASIYQDFPMENKPCPNSFSVDGEAEAIVHFLLSKALERTRMASGEIRLSSNLKNQRSDTWCTKCMMPFTFPLSQKGHNIVFPCSVAMPSVCFEVYQKFSQYAM